MTTVVRSSDSQTGVNSGSVYSLLNSPNISNISKMFVFLTVLLSCSLSVNVWAQVGSGESTVEMAAESDTVDGEAVISPRQSLRLDEQIQLLVSELSSSLVSIQVANPTRHAYEFNEAVGAEMDMSHARPVLLRHISALVVDTGGYLLCAASLLGDDDSMYLTLAGQQCSVERIGVDHRSGLALLRAEGAVLSPVRYSERSANVGAMSLFLAAGSGGIEPLITLAGTSRIEGYVEFSGPTGAGVAGGAFFDMDGELLAVALGSLDELGSVNRIFAIPVSRIAPIVSRLMCCGDRIAGYLGVQVIGTEVRGLSRERLLGPAFNSNSRDPKAVTQPQGSAYATATSAVSVVNSSNSSRASELDESIRGALLTVIESGSPAELAGLRVGDVVFACDDQPIETAEMFSDFIRGCRPDSLIEVVSLRGLQRQTHSIRIAAAPERGGFQRARFINTSSENTSQDDNAALRKIIYDLQKRVESLEKRLTNSSGSSRP